MFPYSNCERNYQHYIASFKEGSIRCFKCAYCSVICNVESIPISDQDALNYEEIRLKNKRDATFCSIMESLAYIEQLEKQQEFLKCKGKDMLRRGLKTMDELDEVEEKERQEKENSKAITTILTNSTDLYAFNPTLA